MLHQLLCTCMSFTAISVSSPYCAKFWAFESYCISFFQDKHKGLCTLLYRERYGTVHPFSLCVVTHLHVACWIENNCEGKFIHFMWFASTFNKILMFWLHVSQHDRDWEICMLWRQALINGRDTALSSSLRSPVHIQNQFNHMLAFKVWSIRHTKLITYPHLVLMLRMPRAVNPCSYIRHWVMSLFC